MNRNNVKGKAKKAIAVGLTGMTMLSATPLQGVTVLAGDVVVSPQSTDFGYIEKLLGELTTHMSLVKSDSSMSQMYWSYNDTTNMLELSPESVLRFEAMSEVQSIKVVYEDSNQTVAESAGSSLDIIVNNNDISQFKVTYTLSDGTEVSTTVMELLQSKFPAITGCTVLSTAPEITKESFKGDINGVLTDYSESTDGYLTSLQGSWNIGLGDGDTYTVFVDGTEVSDGVDYSSGKLSIDWGTDKVKSICTETDGGMHTLVIRTQNKFGITNEQSMNFKLDATVPKVIISTNDTYMDKGGVANYFGENLTLNVSVTDVESGIKSIELSKDGSVVKNFDVTGTTFNEAYSITEDGEYTLKVVDNAGNTQELGVGDYLSTTTDKFISDVEKPVVTTTLNGSSDIPEDWVTDDDVTYHIEATDNGSGVKSLVYTVNGVETKVDGGSADIDLHD